jgi:hypothetical protein
MPSLSPAELDLLEAQRAARRQRVILARRDPVEFNALILKDQENGEPIDPMPVHEEWHRLMTEHPRVVIWSHPEAGKTQQLSIGRALWELGRNPSLRVGVASATAGLAERIIASCALHIEGNDDLHAVFPSLLPTTSEKEPWTASALTVRRSFISKDPSIQAFGIGTKVQGSRIDLLIVDDILDLENTRTPAQRENVFRWLTSEIFSRLSRNARIVFLANAYHKDDAAHRLERMTRAGWVARRFPAIDDKGRPTFPAKWPLSRILEAEDTLPPAEYARQVLCIPPGEADSRFREEWIQLCLSRGAGRVLKPRLVRLPEGFAIFAGVDLGVQQKKDNDHTVLFVILVYPNGDRQPLWIEAGRWTGPEIVDRIAGIWERFRSVIYCESNAAQDFIRQFAVNRDDPPPVFPFNTGRNKSDPLFGVESLAVELRNGSWIIPSIPHPTEQGKFVAADPQLEAWLDELRYYNPLGHTGDRLMASWFAREAARMNPIEGGAEVGVRVLGDKSSRGRDA